MAAIHFAAKLKNAGSLTIPKEAILELGLHPGDEVEVSLEPKGGYNDQSRYDAILAELLAEAERLSPVPAKPSGDTHEAAFGGKSAFEAFSHLIGTERGGPTDVSECPEKYMQGLGETKHIRTLK